MLVMGWTCSLMGVYGATGPPTGARKPLQQYWGGSESYMYAGNLGEHDPAALRSIENAPRNWGFVERAGEVAKFLDRVAYKTCNDRQALQNGTQMLPLMIPSS